MILTSCVDDLAADPYFMNHVLSRRRIRAWNDPLPSVYLGWEGVLFTPGVRPRPSRRAVSVYFSSVQKLLGQILTLNVV